MKFVSKQNGSVGRKMDRIKQKKYCLLRSGGRKNPLKVISGGQTGADQAALRAALSSGLQTGGVAPDGYITSKGKDDSLQNVFHLQELSSFLAQPVKARKSLSSMYVQRSKLNVDHSDGTVAFRTHSSAGTDKTIGYCMTKQWKPPIGSLSQPNSVYKPILVIQSLSHDAMDGQAELIKDFVLQHQIHVLNVCGHRDETLETSVEQIMITAFQKIAKHYS